MGDLQSAYVAGFGVYHVVHTAQEGGLAAAS